MMLTIVAHVTVVMCNSSSTCDKSDALHGSIRRRVWKTNSSSPPPLLLMPVVYSLAPRGHVVKRGVSREWGGVGSRLMYKTLCRGQCVRMGKDGRQGGVWGVGCE